MRLKYLQLNIIKHVTIIYKGLFYRELNKTIYTIYLIYEIDKTIIDLINNYIDWSVGRFLSNSAYPSYEYKEENY